MKIGVVLVVLWSVTVVVVADDTPAPSATSTSRPATKITFAGGDGSSIETAVVILGANEITGVDAEYQWLRDHFPGWVGEEQSLLNRNGKAYDVIKFSMPDNSKHTIYFDISDYFGKM